MTPQDTASLVGRLAAHLDASGLSGWVLDGSRDPAHATTDEPLPTAIVDLPARGSGVIADTTGVAYAWSAAGKRKAEAFLMARVPDSQTPEALAAILAVLTREATALDRAERTLDGFADHLSQSYENTALLYALGKSMGYPTRASDFIDDALERMTRVCDFAHVGLRFNDAVTTVDGLAELAPGDRFHIGGPLPAGINALVPAVMTEDMTIHDDGEHEAVLCRVRAGETTVGTLILAEKSGDDPRVSSYDTQLAEAVAGFITTHLGTCLLHAEQEAAFLGTVSAMTSAIDAKDRYTAGHSQRVALLARNLGASIGLEETTLDRVHLCGLLHDVGKIGVPEAVLCKPGRLDDDEFEMIKQHPDIGARMLSGLKAMRDLIPGVRSHHERWDGRGYPDNLAGNDIPLFGRLLGLADTFDAMSSNRAYRPAMPREKVLAEISRCGGSQFDPELAERFVELDFQPFDDLMAEHKQTAADVQTVIRRDAA